MYRNLIIPLLILFFSSCFNSETKNVVDNPTRHPSPNKSYWRDSLYIAHTVKEFMRKEVDIFEVYNRYKIPLDRVTVDVDSIFCSPDNLKLFSFVIIKSYERDSKILNDYYYSGSGFIGFRDNLKKPWSIWFFGQYRPAGFKSYDKVKSMFRNYYLGKGAFKDDSDYYWDGIHNDTLDMPRSITFPDQSNRIDIPFGYNIDDSRFWDSSIVWKKGSRIPGYFAFQTTGNVAPGYGDNLITKIPPLDYPDSLLLLFNEKVDEN